MNARTVEATGAGAGRVLCGAARNNQGLRLRVLHEQPPGEGGAIRGDFVILDGGDNKHSSSLAALLQRVTKSEEVLRLIRQRHPACGHVANTNTLVVEVAK
jgi:hypothetical protein